MSHDPPIALTHTDKTGQAFSVRPFESRDLAGLQQFYAGFEPKRSAQGLPPDSVEGTRRWLKNVLSRGHHLVVEIGGVILGHLMLMPMEDRPDGLELANFIHQSVRNRGIGTVVNRIGADVASQLGKKVLWLSVEPSNRIAIRSYEKAGFHRLAGSLWAPEIEMEFPLIQCTVSA